MRNFGKGSRIRERAKQQRRGVIVSSDPDQDCKKRQWLVRFDGEKECVPRSSAQLRFDIDYQRKHRTPTLSNESENEDECNRNEIEKMRMKATEIKITVVPCLTDRSEGVTRLL